MPSTRRRNSRCPQSSGLVPDGRLPGGRYVYCASLDWMIARLRGLDAALTSCRGAFMTHTSQASYASQASAGAAFAQGDFRVGAVINRSFSVLSRHFLTFFIVTLVAF